MASSKYKMLSQVEHVKTRASMYIGSLHVQPCEHYILVEETFQKKNLNISPGLFKIFDEVISNAFDQTIRDPTLKNIKVTVDKGEISIMNDGVGIPVEPFEDNPSLMIPEVLFGALLSGSNFDDTQDRYTAGMNGIGAAAANIFSSKFEIDICDGTKRYIQTWKNNMGEKSTPKITSKKGKGFVRVTFQPDFPRFGLSELDTDHIDLFKRRTYDIAALTHAGVTVEFNGAKIKIKEFIKYAAYFGKEPLVTVKNPNWEISICMSDNGFGHMSFVNSVSTMLGGTHVESFFYHIANSIIETFDQKQKKFSGSLKPAMIREKLFLLMNGKVVNPTFNSQTKETLVTPAKNLDLPRLSEKDIAKLYKAFSDDLLETLVAKEEKKLNKTDGKKTSRVIVPKLDDARHAGTSKGQQCTLIITEGDSARAFAISGLSKEDRAWYGVFPLRGKLLNVRDASVTQITNNTEITALKQILGLKNGKKYEFLKDLRYGKLMILTDQDLDGHHIKGLVLNWIDTFWPELIDLGFTCSMFTPIVKAFKGNDVKSYYSIPDFEKDHKAGLLRNYKVKYYKGLGSSSSKEAKEYFASLKKNTIQFKPDSQTRETLSKAFKKDRADDRKAWILENTGREDFTVNNPNITQFVNDELVQFSVYDNQRSIPNVMDGLKPSQRKILYTCLEKLGNEEIKVAQLAPKVAQETSYHHGDVSLIGAIVNMAQDFVGSNQKNLLLPNGMFGTRLVGGKDAASARYIFTQVNPVTRQLFPKEDTPLLDFEESDGQKVEPTYFVPVIPMVLVNGCTGIGTGFSTYVPTYKVKDIVDNLHRYLRGEPMVEIHPYYEGFQGTITSEGQGKYTVTGKYTMNGKNLHVTELPLGVWTDQLKDTLDSLQWDYVNSSTESAVDFAVKLPKEMTEEELCKQLNLRKSINTNNMYLFDSKGKIKKYESPLEILREFASTRKALFETRRLSLLDQTKAQLSRLEHKIQFMELVMNDKIQVFRVPKKGILEQIQAHKLPAYGDYELYLSIRVDEFTQEKVETLKAAIQKEMTKKISLETTTAQAMWSSELSKLKL